MIEEARNAIRMLGRSRLFTGLAASILAVGIGANVALFSVADAVLLDALPFRDPGRLVLGRATVAGNLNPLVSGPDFYDYQAESRSFEGLEALFGSLENQTVLGADGAEIVTLGVASVGLFPMLGVEPQLGRSFTADEAEFGSRALMLSHGYWQRHFGGSPDVIGRDLVVNYRPFTIVGILPPDFHLMFGADLWHPVQDVRPITGVRRNHFFLLIGRLREGVSLGEAQEELDLISRRLEEAYPASNQEKALLLTPLQDALVEGSRPSILLLMAAVAMVLLVCCGNVAGLLLARASARKSELAVRAALGASTGRIARHLITESLALALLAGGVGTLLAIWIQDLLHAYLDLASLGIQEVGLSGPMLGFALLLSVGTVLLFGVIPALEGARVDPVTKLRGACSLFADAGKTHLRSTLVVAQVALSIVLLVGSGLLVRSYARMSGVDPGFDAEDVMTAELRLPGNRYLEPASRIAFFERVVAQLEADPRVEAVGVVSHLPALNQTVTLNVWDPENPPRDPAGLPSAFLRPALPGYFKAMGIPLLRGRDLERTDTGDTPAVVVIGESLANRLFPGQDPLGRRVAADYSREDPPMYTVVGVAGDVRMSGLADDPRHAAYFSFYQWTDFRMRVAVRARTGAETVTEALRAAVANVDPEVPLADPMSMEAGLASTVSGQRTNAIALSLFAIVAVVLAAVGLYGLLAYYVSLRIREIGMRAALGAAPLALAMLVLRRGLALVGIGVVLGTAGALAASHMVRRLLFGIEPWDPMTLAATLGVFAAVAVAALLLPTWQAVRVDPAETLRAD